MSIRTQTDRGTNIELKPSCVEKVHNSPEKVGREVTSNDQVRVSDIWAKILSQMSDNVGLWRTSRTSSGRTWRTLSSRISHLRVEPDTVSTRSLLYWTTKQRARLKTVLTGKRAYGKASVKKVAEEQCSPRSMPGCGRKSDYPGTVSIRPAALKHFSSSRRRRPPVRA